MMISSPIGNNHCKGHCWISTEVDELMVYNAFHKSGRKWYTWRGGAIILKECVFTSGNEVISEL
jgi:hypothetical protein